MYTTEMIFNEISRVFEDLPAMLFFRNSAMILAALVHISVIMHNNENAAKSIWKVLH